MDEIVPSQLVSVAPPLVFLEGAFGRAPGVEALHAALSKRASETPAGVARVLRLLPRAPPDNDGGDGDAADSQQQPAFEQQPDDQQQQQQNHQRPNQPSPLAAASDVFDLDPKLWALRAQRRELPAWAPPPELLEGGDLMAVLQASSYGEEHLDPATSQLRHELPAGFIGVWPELAALRHSCAPNTAVAVVGRGGHMFVHATREVEAGEALTANKIGGAVLAPLAARQAAVRALTGAPCRCARCALEAAQPEALRAQLEDLYARAAGGEWAAALEAAAAAGDAGALDALHEDVTLDVGALTDALAEAGLKPDEADTIAAGAYGAFELAWSLEELSQESPDASRLFAAVRLLRAAAPGTESHVAAALQLNELTAARVAALLKAQRGRRAGRGTAAAERRLLAKVVASNEDAEAALVAFYEAMYLRYGFIPEEGLLPELQSGLQLFYAGLDQLAAQSQGAGGGGADGGDAAAVSFGAAAMAEREIEVGGIPVTVVDRAMGGGGGDDDGGDGGAGGSGSGEVAAGNVRLRVVEAAAGGGGGGRRGLTFGDGDEDDEAAAAEEEAAAAAEEELDAMVGEGSLHDDAPLLSDVVAAEEREGGPEAFLAP